MKLRTLAFRPALQALLSAYLLMSASALAAPVIQTIDVVKPENHLSYKLQMDDIRAKVAAPDKYDIRLRFGADVFKLIQYAGAGVSAGVYKAARVTGTSVNMSDVGALKLPAWEDMLIDDATMRTKRLGWFSTNYSQIEDAREWYKILDRNADRKGISFSDRPQRAANMLIQVKQDGGMRFLFTEWVEGKTAMQFFKTFVPGHPVNKLYFDAMRNFDMAFFQTWGPLDVHFDNFMFVEVKFGTSVIRVEVKIVDTGAAGIGKPKFATTISDTSPLQMTFGGDNPKPELKAVVAESRAKVLGFRMKYGLAVEYLPPPKPRTLPSGKSGKLGCGLDPTSPGKWRPVNAGGAAVGAFYTARDYFGANENMAGDCETLKSRKGTIECKWDWVENIRQLAGTSKLPKGRYLVCGWTRAVYTVEHNENRFTGESTCGCGHTLSVFRVALSNPTHWARYEELENSGVPLKPNGTGDDDGFLILQMQFGSDAVRPEIFHYRLPEWGFPGMALPCPEMG